MKLVLHGDAIVMLIEKSCIVFNNNKFNSLHRYDISKNGRIVHGVVQRLFQHNLKISHRRRVYTYVHVISLYQMLFVEMQRFVSCFQKIICEF
jgi:hypothetical protein